MDASFFEHALHEQGFEISIRANQKRAWVYQGAEEFLDAFDCRSPVKAATIIEAYRTRAAAPSL